jgi:hypothetical protein
LQNASHHKKVLELIADGEKNGTILLKFNSMGLLIKIISKFYDIDISPYYSEKTKSVVGGIYSYFNNIHVRH